MRTVICAGFVDQAAVRISAKEAMAMLPGCIDKVVARADSSAASAAAAAATGDTADGSADLLTRARPRSVASCCFAPQHPGLAARGRPAGQRVCQEKRRRCDSAGGRAHGTTAAASPNGRTLRRTLHRRSAARTVDGIASAPSFSKRSATVGETHRVVPSSAVLRFRPVFRSCRA